MMREKGNNNYNDYPTMIGKQERTIEHGTSHLGTGTDHAHILGRLKNRLLTTLLSLGVLTSTSNTTILAQSTQSAQSASDKIELIDNFFMKASDHLPQEFINKVSSSHISLSPSMIQEAVDAMQAIWYEYIVTHLEGSIDKKLIGRISVFCTIKFLKVLDEASSSAGDTHNHSHSITHSFFGNNFAGNSFIEDFSRTLSSLDGKPLNDYFMLEQYIKDINASTHFFTVLDNIVTLLQLYNDEFYRKRGKHSKILFDSKKFFKLFEDPALQRTYVDHAHLATHISMDDIFDEYYKDPFDTPPKIDDSFLQDYLTTLSIKPGYGELLWDFGVGLSSKPSTHQEKSADNFTSLITNTALDPDFDHASASFLFGVLYGQSLGKQITEYYYHHWLHTNILETWSDIYANPNIIHWYPTQASLPIDTSISEKLKERKKFIQDIYEDARDVSETIQLPVTFIIAQAILESGWGESRLAREGNNYFGIKGSGKTYTTHEIRNGKRVETQAGFAHYTTPKECFEAYAHKVLLQPRYQRALALLTPEQRVDPGKVAEALVETGYATTDAAAYGKKISNISHFVLHYILSGYDKKQQNKGYITKNSAK